MDLDAIRRVEAVYRNRLREDPCDTLARVRLAWCLFAQALHEAGQECAYAALRASVPPTSAEMEGRSMPSSERGSASLLDDCLRQSYAVLHLSASKQDEQDAVELQALARLISGETSLAKAEGWADEILAKIALDITRYD